jgi:hypothetical protein
MLKPKRCTGTFLDEGALSSDALDKVKQYLWAATAELRDRLPDSDSTSTATHFDWQSENFALPVFDDVDDDGVYLLEDERCVHPQYYLSILDMTCAICHIYILYLRLTAPFFGHSCHNTAMTRRRGTGSTSSCCYPFHLQQRATAGE